MIRDLKLATGAQTSGDIKPMKVGSEKFVGAVAFVLGFVPVTIHCYGTFSIGGSIKASGSGMASQGVDYNLYTRCGDGG
jgi:hypothetical protein